MISTIQLMQILVSGDQFSSEKVKILEEENPEVMYSLPRIRAERLFLPKEQISINDIKDKVLIKEKKVEKCMNRQYNCPKNNPVKFNGKSFKPFVKFKRKF